MKIKYLILLLGTFLSALKSLGQLEPQTKEINWYKSIDQALADAKAQNKMLFVECFTYTCPVCMSMEPIFKKPEVVKKYNADFINYKLEVTLAGQVKFLDSKNIYLTSFPQFLFFDSNGNLVHQSDMSPDESVFINVANNAQNTQTRAATYKDRFSMGERGFDFLINYAAYSRLIKDNEGNYKAADELYNLYPKDQISSETSWKITKKCIADFDNGFGKFWINNVALAAKYEANDGHNGAEITILGGLISGPLNGAKGKTYSVEKLQEVKKYMKLLKAEQYIDGATWQQESKALIRENRPTEALPIANKIMTKFYNQVEALQYISKFYNDEYPDKGYAVFMKTLLARIKQLAKTEGSIAYNLYETARYYKKIGDVPNAKLNAKKGQAIALKLKDEPEKFAILLKELP
jgi:thioredoxin-related protein